MQTTIKAIETHYNGYRFRSRLEARWAVFFDTLGIKYEYEKEGYDLGTMGWYLPDFWLPNHRVFVEIKGQEPTIQECAKAAALSLSMKCHTVIFPGSDFPVKTHYAFYYQSWKRHFQLINENPHHSSIAGPEMHALRMQDKVLFDRTGYVWSTITMMKESGVGLEWNVIDGQMDFEIIVFDDRRDPRIIAAAAAARQARFEHGEHGRG